MAYTTQEIKDYINAQGIANDPDALYKAAQQFGVSGSEIDTALGYDQGTSSNWVKSQGYSALPSAPAPAPAPAPDAGLQYSDADVAQYIQKIQSMGLSPLEQEKAIYEASLQYGVGLDQVGRVMGLHQAEIDQWINTHYPTPENPANVLADAQAATKGLLDWTPERVTGATATSQGYTPETIAGQNMSQYMNPYTQEVIDASLADLERQRLMQTNNLGFSATQAGAFGGSRHGVAEALTNEGFARTGAQMASNLRNQGYSQALQTAGQDVASMNQALGFGAAAGNTANLANAGYAQQANLANQNMGLAGAQFQLGAANQLANLGNMGFNQQNTINQQLFNQGLAQQQMNQQLINNAMAQYTNWSGQNANNLGLVPGAAGALGNTGTTSQGYQPGLMDFLGTAIWGYGVMK